MAKRFSKQLSRRDFLTRTSALAGALALNPALKQRLFAAPGRQDVPASEPITILINDSPWFDGFNQLVKLYEETSGNEVNLDVVAFPDMLPLSEEAVAAEESPYDLLNLNEQWYSQFYGPGTVMPIHEIDPDFELDPNIIEYAAATRWDDERGASTDDGRLYGLPINGNIQLYFYRRDLLQDSGLDVPKTWEQVEALAEAIHNPPLMHGFAVRADRLNWELQAYMQSLGVNYVMQDVESGEWSIGMETDQARQAVGTYVRLGQKYGPANYPDLNQALLISTMADGLLGQAHMVGAAAPNFQNPAVSIVVDLIEAAPVPGFTEDTQATISGIWVMGIPANIPAPRQQAALTFLKWALSKDAQIAYTQAGAIPVRQDVYEELSDDPNLGWWTTAFANSTDFIRPQVRIPEASQIYELADTHVRSALIEGVPVDEAVDTLAAALRDVMTEAGYALTT